MNQFWEGFFLQASLIVALGAQNIFVLESGLKKRHHILVAGVCSLCDLALIAIGVGGAATLFVQLPILKILFGAIGVGFLVFYGGKKIAEACKTTAVSEAADLHIRSIKKTIWWTLGFSLLNPHVYLDTIVLIGGYSTKFDDLAIRFIFGLGAGTLSILWFFTLAIFASVMGRFLKSPNALRAIAAVSGIILLLLAWKLGHDVLVWI